MLRLLHSQSIRQAHRLWKRRRPAGHQGSAGLPDPQASQLGGPLLQRLGLRHRGVPAGQGPHQSSDRAGRIWAARPHGGHDRGGEGGGGQEADHAFQQGCQVCVISSPNLKHGGCDNLMEPCSFMMTSFFAEIATSTLWGWTRRASWSPCRGWGKVPWWRRESLARRTMARERRTEADAHPFSLPVFSPCPWSCTVCTFKQRDLATVTEGFNELFLHSFLGNSRLKCRAVIVAHWLKGPVYFIYSFVKSLYISRSKDQSRHTFVPLSQYPLQPPFLTTQMYNKDEKTLTSTQNLMQSVFGGSCKQKGWIGFSGKAF